MRSFVAAFIGTVLASSAFAQGTIQFNNRVTGTSTSAVVAPVYDVNPADPTQPKNGNTATGIPAGTQTYYGTPLTGSGFTASLWARQAGTQNPFVLAATTPFRITTSTSLYGFWTIPSTAVVLPNVPSDPAVRADILIRVWDNRGGTITSWEQLILPENCCVRFGESAMFTTRDQLGGGLVLPPTLVGLQSFQLYMIPEPSVIALGILVVGCLLLGRRRK